MTHRRRQTSLFVLCAAVLLSAGYGWGYANAYVHFFGLTSIMDREMLDLEFNARLLHYADANEMDKVRSRLVQRLSQEVHFVDRVLESSVHKSMAGNAADSLTRARLALGEPHNLGSVAVNAGAANQSPPPAQP